MVNKKICSSTYFGHNYNSNIINALRTASTSNRPDPPTAAPPRITLHPHEEDNAPFRTGGATLFVTPSARRGSGGRMGYRRPPFHMRFEDALLRQRQGGRRREQSRFQLPPPTASEVHAPTHMRRGAPPLKEASHKKKGCSAARRGIPSLTINYSGRLVF